MSEAAASLYRLETGAQLNSYFWYFSPSGSTVGYL